MLIVNPFACTTPALAHLHATLWHAPSAILFASTPMRERLSGFGQAALYNFTYAAFWLWLRTELKNTQPKLYPNSRSPRKRVQNVCSASGSPLIARHDLCHKSKKARFEAFCSALRALKLLDSVLHSIACSSALMSRKSELLGNAAVAR